MSKARPFTSKFFTLSYYNTNTGNYAAGFDDSYFVIFCIVLFTGLRAGLMDYILAPLAKHWGISKKKDITRFSEQGWMLIYYNVLCPLGMHLYYNSPYFLNMAELWTNWPQRELSGLMKAYILAQWSYCIQEVFVINIEDRRKDHWQMLTHHFVTIFLITASYSYHQTRVGSLILMQMDFIDLVLPLAKCLKYLGYTTICDIVFGVFIVSWLLTRHVFYMMTCWSVYSDLPRTITPACYSGTADNLQGPFPAPQHGWSHLLSPFRQPAGTVCWNDNIMSGFLACLLFLQAIMILWSVFIIRVAMRVLSGGSAEDVRSDVEDEEEEELLPFEEEVGVEDIDLKAWERRMSVKRGGVANSTTSGISIPGHSDAKDLLNRIGCEKQID
ncbi:Sphingosine N-acyltransferase-like protein FUM18 [Lachnellula suecica]|uniref:Sphingosine N-acyltransferase-like protein FUM18 n=1 Tax=Lachnellula suecica TaxID=602035 RepID=A0A8T9BU48_9HELO|nr:Sphingosine N-acyltransferase-like protein FUM18 [Lachnellula suecica]